MKQKVAARERPWIDGWELLIKDPKAQSGYRDGADINMGERKSGKPAVGRQRSSADAHAAYLNFIRWYVSGDRAYADCAIRICNNWSAKVCEESRPGLTGIPIGEFAMVGELLRCCPYWKAEDQERFKSMMRTYLYPGVKAFLDEHNKNGSSETWANWDICNVQALVAMGVLLDDRRIFNEGIDYFKSGRGTGSIKNAVYHMHPGGLGQWQESGRDQGHAQLCIGMMGQLCQVAWNQGVDLFSHDNNRLLAGIEYVGATALLEKLPFKYYNNDSDAMNYWLSVNGYGRLSSPVWELLHNHYVVRKGIKSPRLFTMAKLTRPEPGGGDHFGYGTLTYTLDANASPYPGKLPLAPAGLTARPGLGRVTLDWNPAATRDAGGYVVRRAKSGSGTFETIGNWNRCVANQYIDNGASPGTDYDYVVAARNPAGVGPDSELVTAKAEPPGPLPKGWSLSRIGPGTEDQAGRVEASYSETGSRSLRIKGIGRNLGGSEDSATFAGCEVKGDCELVGRLIISPQVNFPKSSSPKMGLMIRESTMPGAPGVALSLGEVGLRGTRARFRTEAGAKSVVCRGNDYSWMPIWYKLKRSGDTLTAWHCMDGKSWIEVGSSKVKLPEKCLAGFFVTGSDGSQTGTVEVMFEYVSLRTTELGTRRDIKDSF
ncbi:MAG: alginate lyase family protein [Verrucomicrobia bacterium]|nr:alginate lyase family protein [Verrucomicrobiota bacterium]